MTTLEQTEARLVDPDTLASRLDDPRWVVVDARFRLADRAWGARVYAEGHIPGSFHARLEDDLSAPAGPNEGRHPLPDPRRFARFLASCGVTPETTLVACDEIAGPGAFRLWWLALWIGLRDVRVLDGGLRAWTAHGFPLVSSPSSARGRDDVLVPCLREGLIVDSADVELWVQHGSRKGVLIDARERRRYLGLEEPIDRVPGHIPGARNLPFAATLGPDGRLLPPETLRLLFTRVLGSEPPAKVAHACGSGVTACQTLFAMTRAGLRGGLLYPGSYSAWVGDPRRAVAVGPEDGLEEDAYRLS